MSPETQQARVEETAAKTLNVLFMYNGHTWDAYEILGLPAGAPLTAVTEAYQKMQKTMSPESREFMDTAYRVLQQELTRRSQGPLR